MNESPQKKWDAYEELLRVNEEKTGHRTAVPVITLNKPTHPIPVQEKQPDVTTVVSTE